MSEVGGVCFYEEADAQLNAWRHSGGSLQKGMATNSRVDFVFELYSTHLNNGKRGQKTLEPPYFISPIGKLNAASHRALSRRM